MSVVFEVSIVSIFPSSSEISVNVTLGTTVSRVAVNVSCTDDFPQPSLAVTRIVNCPSPELAGILKFQLAGELSDVSVNEPTKSPEAPWIFAVTDFTPLASVAVPWITKSPL